MFKCGVPSLSLNWVLRLRWRKNVGIYIFLFGFATPTTNAATNLSGVSSRCRASAFYAGSTRAVNRSSTGLPNYSVGAISRPSTRRAIGHTRAGAHSSSAANRGSTYNRASYHRSRSGARRSV